MYRVDHGAWHQQEGDIIKNISRGTWLAQSVEHATLDLGVVSLSPTPGVKLP